MPTGPLCALLLAWWDEHGRHDIPWKRASASGQPDPYGIWIAEVMLYSATYIAGLEVSVGPFHGTGLFLLARFQWVPSR